MAPQAGRAGTRSGQASSGPPSVFGLQRRISKNLATPVVVDNQANGRVYAGPVSLQRFEENAGASNSSLLRFEGNAVFGVERSSAAVRITQGRPGGTKLSGGLPQGGELLASIRPVRQRSKARDHQPGAFPGRRAKYAPTWQPVKPGRPKRYG